MLGVDGDHFLCTLLKSIRIVRSLGFVTLLLRKIILTSVVELGVENVEIIVANISTFEVERSFHRIYSIGMFEHMKNYKELLKKISGWMKEDALLFVQHFCHKTFAYHFEV
uniref:Uncharacterized protein n=1 Tax=Cannabis sativa TaxID=3483 RepID=A0A803R2G6_CANSA